MRPTWVLIAGLCVCSSAVASPAQVEPTRWSVGLSPLYAFIVLEDSAEPRGGGVNLFAHLELDRGLMFRLSASWTGHDVTDSSGDEGSTRPLYQVYNLAAGVQYSFDLVAVRPALELGLGVLHTRVGERSATNLELQFGLCVDYWVVSWLGVGAALHYHAFLSNPADYPVYFDAGPRVEVRFP